MRKEKKKCPYCGDAPVNHGFSYFGGTISMFLDPVFGRLGKAVPSFVVNIAELFLKLLFLILVVLRIVRFSDDPEKAATLRSRVIWDEAIKRGIHMEQVVVFGKYTDNYRAKIKGKYVYFDSLPLPSTPFSEANEWDDKFFMKERFLKENIPVPLCVDVPVLRSAREKLFDRLEKPIIVKPRVGSRGRHTTTSIHTFEEFEKAFRLARVICPQAVAEEHLSGYVCRATCVSGKLAGFYRAEPASVIGDGLHTISELIEQKDESRPERVEKVKIGEELSEQIGRQGFNMGDILPSGVRLELSHRIGRLFGGITKEMLDGLHPSFVPILERAARTTGLPVAGFDCIIPDPEAEDGSQRWGIIECNTLPFIDLHYYALEGKPKNIAGMIWDLCYNS